MKTRKMLASSLAVILASLTIGMAAAKAGGDTRLTAPLTSPGGGAAKGLAEFRSRADGSAQLKVQVENVNLPGATLNVQINGAQIGTITIDAATLAGQLQLNTKDGASVPPIKSGSAVSVTDAAGTQIVNGFF